MGASATTFQLAPRRASAKLTGYQPQDSPTYWGCESAWSKTDVLQPCSSSARDGHARWGPSMHIAHAGRITGPPLTYGPPHLTIRHTQLPNGRTRPRRSRGSLLCRQASLHRLCARRRAPTLALALGVEIVVTKLVGNVGREQTDSESCQNSGANCGRSGVTMLWYFHAPVDLER